MSAENDLDLRVRAALQGVEAVREVKMFGGVGFMVNGNLVAAASKRGLLLRVGRERQDEALAQPGIRPMEMRGRRMEGLCLRRSAAALRGCDQGLASVSAGLRPIVAAEVGRRETQAGERTKEMTRFALAVLRGTWPSGSWCSGLL